MEAKMFDLSYENSFTATTVVLQNITENRPNSIQSHLIILLTYVAFCTQGFDLFSKYQLNFTTRPAMHESLSPFSTGINWDS